VKPIQIRNLRKRHLDDKAELAISLQIGNETQDIWFRTQHPSISHTVDPFVPTMLLPAMRRGWSVEFEDSMSASMYEAAKKVQQVECLWHPDWSPVHLSSPLPADTVENSSSGQGVGLFFSGGVDSFYSLQRHLQQITHLIFVHGFDIPVNRPSTRDLAVPPLKQVAQELNLGWIEVETNLRQFSDRHIPWSNYSGTAIAAVAHLLAPTFKQIYMAAGRCHIGFVTDESHPALEPLWSTESLQVVFDSAEVSRFDKTHALTDWPVALQNLRVCYQNKRNHYNCCQCRKCLWTMMALQACNALDRAVTFDQPLNLKALSDVPLTLIDQRYSFVRALDQAEQIGHDPALVATLQAILQRRYVIPRLRTWLSQQGRQLARTSLKQLQISPPDSH
jgi:hypothetical protein